jgi:hypothetical protein
MNCNKRSSYIVLRGRWCNIVVLNIHESGGKESNDSKDGFYEELEEFFNHFPKCHMKIMLGDFNVKLRERLFSNRHLGVTF